MIFHHLRDSSTRRHDQIPSAFISIRISTSAVAELSPKVRRGVIGGELPDIASSKIDPLATAESVDASASELVHQWHLPEAEGRQISAAAVVTSTSAFYVTVTSTTTFYAFASTPVKKTLNLVASPAFAGPGAITCLPSGFVVC